MFLKHNYGIKHVIHILDDFFLEEQSKLACFNGFSTLLRVFMSLKAPLVASKRPFPGYWIYGNCPQLILQGSLPTQGQAEQDSQASNLIPKVPFHALGWTTVPNQHSLVCLQKGCPRQDFSPKGHKSDKGVPSRFHKKNKEFFKDLDVWKAFLNKCNGHSFFLELSITWSLGLDLHTDATSSVALAVFSGESGCY